MKKKVALFANGWSGDNVHNLVDGLFSTFPREQVDIFVFLGHATYGLNEDIRLCEAAIYDLPDLSKFDAAIIFGASLNCSDIQEHVYERCVKSGIPLISINVEHEKCVNIMVDNYVGMSDLCNHLLEKHYVNTVFYVAGSKENPDSAIRKTAIEDCMKKHNLPFDDSDVFYTDWELAHASGYVNAHFSTIDNLPDAIICANDLLAESVVNALYNHGINVPGDVIVTGFDLDPESQVFYPAIASVNQNYHQLGIKAAQLLQDIFAGKSVDNKHIVDCTFYPSESCRCLLNSFEDNIPRMTYLRQLPKYRDDIHRRNLRLHQMEVAITSSENYEDLSVQLQDVFYSNNAYEGDSFHILSDSALEKSLRGKKTGLNNVLPPQLNVMVSKENGVIYPETTFNTADLIPGYVEDGDNHVYTFMALFFSGTVFGYMIMKDNITYYHESIFRKFSDVFNNSLDSCRKNIQLSRLNQKLSELMNRDALTSVKNRTAFETYTTELDNLCKKGKCKEFAVVMFDVNNLKKINDALGHEKGDLYLQNSCKLICNTFKHSPIFRIGGDEFVSIIRDEDYSHREELLSLMRDSMEAMKRSTLPPEEVISIATGMAIYDNKDKDIKTLLKEADTLMYENKREMKGAMFG